jgi:hypothetical protein
VNPSTSSIGRRRRWLALSAATLVGTISYWAVVLAFATAEREGASEPSLAALAFGLAITPLVFVTLAAASGHPSATVGALAGMGLFLLVAPLIALFVDPVTGMVAGFGAGAVVGMRKEEVHDFRSRSVAVGFGVVAVLVGLFALPPVAIAFGPAVPFVAVGVADGWRERHVEPSSPEIG